MKAKKDLPQWCVFCGHQIKKGMNYIYEESKKHNKGYAYYHRKCKYGDEK